MLITAPPIVNNTDAIYFLITRRKLFLTQDDASIFNKIYTLPLSRLRLWVLHMFLYGNYSLATQIL